MYIMLNYYMRGGLDRGGGGGGIPNSVFNKIIGAYL